jgi:hypothetical protein
MASLGMATLTTRLDTPLFVRMVASVVCSVLRVVFYMSRGHHVLRGPTTGSVKGEEGK